MNIIMKKKSAYSKFFFSFLFFSKICVFSKENPDFKTRLHLLFRKMTLASFIRSVINGILRYMLATICGLNAFS